VRISKEIFKQYLAFDQCLLPYSENNSKFISLDQMRGKNKEMMLEKLKKQLNLKMDGF